MSNDIQKADQIAFHFYTKLFYVVNQARATSEPKTQGKIDKWVGLFYLVEREETDPRSSILRLQIRTCSRERRESPSRTSPRPQRPVPLLSRYKSSSPFLSWLTIKSSYTKRQRPASSRHRALLSSKHSPWPSPLTALTQRLSMSHCQLYTSTAFHCSGACSVF